MGLLPQKKALVERLKDEPFSFLGMFGREGDPKEIAARMKRENINWRSALDLGEPKDGVALEHLGRARLPAVLPARRAGRDPRSSWFGDPTAELDGAIEELLAEARPAK